LTLRANEHKKGGRHYKFHHNRGEKRERVRGILTHETGPINSPERMAGKKEGKKAAGDCTLLLPFKKGRER